MFYYVLFGRKHSRRTTDQNWKGTKLNFGSEKKKNQTNQPDGSVRSDHPDGSVRLDHPDGNPVRLVILVGIWPRHEHESCRQSN